MRRSCHLYHWQDGGLQGWKVTNNKMLSIVPPTSLNLKPVMKVEMIGNCSWLNAIKHIIEMYLIQLWPRIKEIAWTHFEYRRYLYWNVIKNIYNRLYVWEFCSWEIWRNSIWNKTSTADCTNDSLEIYFLQDINTYL